MIHAKRNLKNVRDVAYNYVFQEGQGCIGFTICASNYLFH
jgi:hypothetical protein